jgi:hypothetical protein
MINIQMREKKICHQNVNETFKTSLNIVQMIKKLKSLNMFERAEKLHQKLKELFICISVGIPEVVIQFLSVSQFAPKDFVLIDQTIDFAANNQPFAILLSWSPHQ